MQTEGQKCITVKGPILPMDPLHIPKEGQLLVGPLFNEPMLVETVRSGGVAVWTVGLVGNRTHQFRRVQLSENDLGLLRIVETSRSFDGDPQLLKLAVPAYALGIATRFVKRESAKAAAAGDDPRVADEALKTRREATTLDRVQAAMLLQAGGRANALRSLLKSETERSPDFLRLANALSAQYPKVSEEKRHLDAMLLAAPR
jgi:hypothetical protein